MPHEKEGQQQKSVAVYARVSQPIQKTNGDLDRQVELVKDEASKRDLCVARIYTDVASGLNDKRRGLWKMCHEAHLNSKFFGQLSIL
jgi:predicted site-specific integrase-resolvase